MNNNWVAKLFSVCIYNNKHLFPQIKKSAFIQSKLHDFIFQLNSFFTERLIDYSPVGERYSNPMLQTIMNYLSNTPPSGKKMLVIGTTSCEDFLERVGLDKKFGMCRHVPCIMNVEQVEKVLNLLSNTFTDKERKEVSEYWNSWYF